MDKLLEVFVGLKDASPLLSLLLVGIAIIVYAYLERTKAAALVLSEGQGAAPVTALRKDMDMHVNAIHGRITEHHEEFLRFKVEVAKELATKEDLRMTEIRIKDHITTAITRRR